MQNEGQQIEHPIYIVVKRKINPHFPHFPHPTAARRYNRMSCTRCQPLSLGLSVGSLHFSVGSLHFSVGSLHFSAGHLSRQGVGSGMGLSGEATPNPRQKSPIPSAFPRVSGVTSVGSVGYFSFIKYIESNPMTEQLRCKTF